MDEFSFPSPPSEVGSRLSYPHYAASPLWFSTASSVGEDGGERAAAEKMDQLWEELNDDLNRRSSSEKQSGPLFWLVQSTPQRESLQKAGGGGTRCRRKTAAVAALRLVKRVMSAANSPGKKLARVQDG
ncbi:uncharacterized protein LOC144705896 [Wolffia australiana]